MSDYTEDAARGPLAVLERRERDEEIRRQLRRLPYRQLVVTLGRFGFHGEVMLIRELASVLGISRERVRQIEARALYYLRHPSRSRRLR